MKIPSYDNQLLNLAEDLARRLLPAFDTPTGVTTGSFFHDIFDMICKFLLTVFFCISCILPAIYVFLHLAVWIIFIMQN